MLFLMDNFEVYDTPKDSGAMDTQWLEKQYILDQTANTGLRIFEGTDERIALGNQEPFTGQRRVLLPLGVQLTKTEKITVSQKLIDFTPSEVAIGGICLLGSSVNDILLFGFRSNKLGFVRYAKDGVVKEDTFVLPTGLGLQADTIEWSFEKDSSDETKYKGFVLWVNNRAAYVGEVFCQVGNSASIAAMVLGGVSNKAVGSDATGVVTDTANVNVPKYGTTDLVVNDGPRLGMVRAISRAPTRDAGPNSMAPSISAESHADVINKNPPSATNFLTAISTTAEEMYGSNAFPDLSSEAVLGVSLVYLAQKNNPQAFDLKGTLKLDGKVHETDVVPVDLTQGFTGVILERNPWTGLRWTPLEANSVNFGMKVV